jgi:hypothetical protein
VSGKSIHGRGTASAKALSRSSEPLPGQKTNWWVERSEHRSLGDAKREAEPECGPCGSGSNLGRNRREGQ